LASHYSGLQQKALGRPVRMRGPLAFQKLFRQLFRMKIGIMWRLAMFMLSAQLLAEEVVVSVLRKQVHEQAGTQLSTVVPSAYFGMVAIHDGGRFSFAAWDPPSRIQVALSRTGAQLGLVDQRSSAVSLQSFMPQGLHQVYARLGDDWLETGMNLGVLEFPSPPVISNYVDLQSIPPGRTWTVQWDRWAEATAADRIEVRLLRWDDTYEATEIPVSTITGGNELPGDATSATIEAVLLQDGVPYSVEVAFVRLDTDQRLTGPVPVRQVAGDVAATRALIRKSTAAGPSPALSFSVTTTTGVDFPMNSQWMLVPGFPAAIQSSVRLDVADAQAVPTQSLIFNGPQQTLGDTPASFVEITSAGHRYQTLMGTVDYPPAGSYSALYRAATYAFDVTDVPTASQHRLPQITVEMENDAAAAVITAFTVAWRDPAGGAASPPLADTVQAHWFDDDGNTLAMLIWEPEETVRMEFSKPVPITWLRRAIVSYTTPDGNRFATEFDLYPSVRQARDYLRPAGIYVEDWIRVMEFGWLKASAWPWAWHANHGWILFEGPGFPHRLYYDKYLGWTWTATFITPHYYSYSREEWLWFASGSRTPARWFYSYRMGRWFNEAEAPAPGPQ
jgi:hypothetical protein